MSIRIRGARQHNLKDISLEIGAGLTVVSGVSGSGKTSLVFDTLYHEARRRFLEIYSLGSASARLSPAEVDAISGLGPAVAVGQNLLNRNPNSTLATASGLHPFLRLLYTHFGERSCPSCGSLLTVYSPDELVERLADLLGVDFQRLSAVLLSGVQGSHRTLLALLSEQFPADSIIVDGAAWLGQALQPDQPHSLELLLAETSQPLSTSEIRHLLEQAAALGSQALRLSGNTQTQVLALAPVCAACGDWFGDLQPLHFRSLCPHCAGSGCPKCQHSGLHPQAAGVRLGSLRFDQLLDLSVDEALPAFQSFGAALHGCPPAPGDRAPPGGAAAGRVGLHRPGPPVAHALAAARRSACAWR